MSRNAGRSFLIALVLVSAVLAACGRSREVASPTPRPLLTPVPTRTPMRLATATPSATPVPTLSPTAAEPPSPTPEPAPSATPRPANRATASARLNVRTGPGLVYPVITTLLAGEQVTVLAQSADGTWLHVRLADGRTGWVARAFTNFKVEVAVAASVPPTPTPSPSPTPPPGRETSGAPSPSEELTPSPRGKLVFQVAPGGPIYVINADGSGLRRVAEAGLDPTWSPDGSRIAFVDWRTPAGIYVVNADGSGLYRLFDGQLIRHPDWSPDGKRIIFTWQKGGRLQDEEVCFGFFGCFVIPADPFWRLALVSVPDGALRELRSDLRSFSPSWNAGGVEIVYRGDPPFGRGIALRRWRVAYDSDARADARLLLADPRARDPRWCANGQIALTYRQHDHWEIYVVNDDGSGLRRLTFNDPLSFEPPADNVAPAWSPDCRQIAFLSNRDGLWRIYVMNADGSNQRPMFGDRLDFLGLTYTGYDDRVLDWVDDGP